MPTGQPHTWAAHWFRSPQTRAPAGQNHGGQAAGPVAV